ncbi:MAG: hypothetical protein J7L59_03000 [Nanoarchaeota archaeon]|nr:hypothetical protein [Nanoarchaeota archaeon]
MKKITPLGVEIDYREYWKRRKERLWCNLQLNYERMRTLLSTGQFTLEDFCEFLFQSEKKAKIAEKMIKLVKHSEEPLTFKRIASLLNTPKSTTWQVYLMLKRAGIFQRKTKAEPVRLSTKFSEVLEDLELWWKNYVKVK